MRPTDYFYFVRENRRLQFLHEKRKPLRWSPRSNSLTALTDKKHTETTSCPCAVFFACEYLLRALSRANPQPLPSKFIYSRGGFLFRRAQEKILLAQSQPTTCRSTIGLTAFSLQTPRNHGRLLKSKIREKKPLNR